MHLDRWMLNASQQRYLIFLLLSPDLERNYPVMRNTKMDVTKLFYSIVIMRLVIKFLIVFALIIANVSLHRREIAEGALANHSVIQTPASSSTHMICADFAQQ